MTVVNSYDKPAGEVKRGNFVFGTKVIETRPKRVNTTIVLEQPVAGRTEWPFKLTDMLEVGVEELTDEEKAERQAQAEREEWKYFAEALRNLHPQAVAAHEAALARKAERLEKGWGRLDYSSLEDELTAAAKVDVTKPIAYSWERFDKGEIHNHPGEECAYTEPTPEGRRCVKPSVPLTEREVAERIFRSLSKQIFKDAVDRRVRSRSTSLFSNLCEDLKEEARGSLINDLRWKTPRSLRIELNTDYDF